MSGWTDKRPMSPHTSIWKWHLTMASSILHRVTGVGNYLGIFIVVAWLFATAAGPDYYEPLSAVTGSIWGQLILFGFTLSVSYHLVNGLRHLFMDAGLGYNPKFASFTAGLGLVAAVVIAVAIWLLAGLVPGIDPLNMTGAA
ncbi:MAG: succinate dehydrogenase, cytochrome b556 subunit [Hyphomonadaceae bacterium]|nr:succinate dehydrogenase, cytochrome b556 subunit [Hyphomonadaceae bacterium]